MRRAAGRRLALLALLATACAGGAVLFLQAQGIAPRTLAPYIEKRSAGHNPVIVGVGQLVGKTLRSFDRGAVQPDLLPALTVGAQPVAVGTGAGVVKLVGSEQAARAAFAAAAPGDAITFVPGTYRIRASIAALRPGTAAAPILVRAGLPGTVFIEFETTEGFVVAAPHWQFENLTIRGVCATDGACEHAFHVIGAGHHFAARNNTILDFNAHFKINGERTGFPDHGLIEGNTLANQAPRRTANPVTPIDLVAAGDWTIRGNLIHDFIKADGDRISYGAFAKGAGARTVFERNVVLCEQRLRGHPGQRVGLSFGGGGTGQPYCRDKKCITEQEQGIMRANLIASCSDAGIYLNNAAASRIEHNTLIDTAGIDVRFAGSSADVLGNLVDGPIRSRDGGALRLGANADAPLAYSYAGYHPIRQLFRNPGGFDFGWRTPPKVRDATGGTVDLCGARRPSSPRFGAFEDFATCLLPDKRL
jgi:hypothetical protein